MTGRLTMSTLNLLPLPMRSPVAIPDLLPLFGVGIGPREGA